MILELAEVMRYHLQFSKRKQIDIEDEIRLINSYIQLEKLRLNDSCNLQIDINHPSKSLSISPLLLLPFVENAFKHGTHPKKACFIKMNLNFKENQLHLKVENSVINNKNIVKTHVGLKNVKEQLKLSYKNKHSLEISESGSIYRVVLKLKL